MSNAGPKLMMAAAGQGGTSLVEVEKSALFDDDNAEYLHRTGTATQTNTKKWTYSTWVYRGNTGSTMGLLSGGSGSVSGRTDFGFNSSNVIYFDFFTGSWTQRVTTAVFRDIGWYHIVLIFDAANGTADDTLILYVNNVRTYWTVSTGVPNNLSLVNADTKLTTVGAEGSLTPQEFDGYLAETVMIDGQALTPSSFGEASTDGLYWTPKSSTDIKALTFGTNGFYLDNATNAQTDASGNGNNFTNNNSVVLSSHSPTNQYAILSPISKWGTYNSMTLSNGNLDADNTDAAYDKNYTTLCTPPSGKWGFQYTVDGAPNGSHDMYLGWVADPAPYTGATNGSNKAAYSMGTHTTGGDLYKNGSVVETGLATFADNDVIEILLDVTNGTCDILRNSVAYGSQITGMTAASYFACIEAYNIGAEFDFGQNGYTPSDGDYLALNTTNIAAATTRTQSDPYEHWNNILYTGNGTAIGSGGQAITGAGFQPDFGWLKGRSGATEHVLTDIVRGVTKELSSNDTGAEETVAEGLTAFGSDGFTVGSDGSYNTSSATYVAWLAKLGGAPTTDNVAGAGNTPTAGSVKIDGVNLGSALAGSIAATRMTVNTTLSMSMGTYTGVAATATVAHGLGVKPAMIILKKVASAQGWLVYHEGMDATAPEDYGLLLDTTAARVDNAAFFNDTPPTSSLFTISTSASAGEAAEYEFMAFAPSEYISIGSYEGNGNADGSLIPTISSLGIGLQPIWFMQKSIDSTSDWIIHDAAREGYNVDNDELAANTTAAEGTADQVDIVSGGIKNRIATDPNVAETNIYIAIGIPTIDKDGRLLTAR